MSSLAPPAPSPAPVPTPAPPQPAPPQLASFQYTTKATPRQRFTAPAHQWQLLPGKDWIHPVEPVVDAGRSWDVAVKIAHARAGVGLSGQAQAIIRDARTGALGVTGLAHLFTVPGAQGADELLAIPAFVSGPAFDNAMRRVKVTRTHEALQAVVGPGAIVDLRKRASAAPKPLVRRA